jgi:hypothetical protein
MIEYLESKGWYFDEKRAKDFTWMSKAERVRDAPAWTVPQWGEYWMEPYSDKPGHKNYGKPKTRRYESLSDAFRSQLLREEMPEQFGVFFKDDDLTAGQ